MAAGYFITVDAPPFGVSFIADPNALTAAETTTALLREGRTVYVTTPDGDLMSGKDFLAEIAQRC